MDAAGQKDCLINRDFPHIEQINSVPVASFIDKCVTNRYIQVVLVDTAFFVGDREGEK